MNSMARGRRILKGQVDRGAAAMTGRWTEAEIAEACQACGHVWRDRYWTPMRTLWAFLLQVLHDGSCREAVALVLGRRGTQGRFPISDRTQGRRDASQGRRGRRGRRDASLFRIRFMIVPNFPCPASLRFPVHRYAVHKPPCESFHIVKSVTSPTARMLHTRKLI
jgi:hypothetical protein